MKKSESSRLVTIQNLSHDGRGIAVVNNKKLFVSGALPQEKITYELTKKHNRYNEGKVLTILSASSERATPPCKHFDICGGCSLQHLEMSYQLKFKLETLINQLKHFGQVVPENILPPLHINEIGYRHKARLGVKFVIKKGKILVGFREKQSGRYLADLDECIVLHPRVGAHFELLKTLIASLDCYRDIPQIEVAIGDDEVALVFRHLHSLLEKDKEKLRDFAQKYRFHIYLQPNPPATIEYLGPNQAEPRLSYRLPDEQLEFLFHPLDFTQINLEMNKRAVEQAMRLLDPQKNEKILDLFCGIGNFTLPLARRAYHVTGVEGSEEMVLRAKENARYNNIQNVTFIAADLLQACQNQAWMQNHYDKMLLDPPRTGAKTILPYLNQCAIQRIAYVSCNPATLARDAGELVNQYHYCLKQVGIMNMFPHTSHIEAIAIFEKY